MLNKIGKDRVMSLYGIDLVVGEDDQVYILDINAKPVGMMSCDSLKCTGALCEQNAIEHVSRALVHRAQAKAVCLVLSDRYSFVGNNSHANQIYCVHDPKGHQYILSSNIIADFNAIADTINELGGKCYIATSDALSWSDNKLLLNSTIPVGATLSRSYKRDFGQFDFNSYSASTLCRDKVNLAYYLSRYCKDALFPRSYEANKFYRRTSTLNGYYVLKPRNGSGSIGVRRIRHSDIVIAVRDVPAKEYLVQEWVPSRPAAVGKWRYRYDIRVFIVDGNLASACARIAPTPINGICADSELEWLTTLGTSYPLTINSSNNTASVSLPESIAKQITDICQSSISALDLYPNYKTKTPQLVDNMSEPINSDTQIWIDTA